MSERRVILCLHGCHMTAETMKSCMKALTTKSGGKNFEWVFIDALFAHPDGGRTWTFPPLIVESLADKNGNCAIQYDPDILADTFALLDKTIADRGVTHLLGFSQGAFAAVQYVLDRETLPETLQGVMAMSGYTFRGEVRISKLPVICIDHQMDSVVPHTCSYIHATARHVHNIKEFKEPTRDAHKIPTQAQFRNMILSFVKSGRVGK